MEIEWTPKALDQLAKLPRSAQKRSALKMRFYERQKQPLVFAKRLIGAADGAYRFRIGDFRVIVDELEHRLVAIKVARRDRVYE